MAKFQSIASTGEIVELEVKHSDFQRMARFLGRVSGVIRAYGYEKQRVAGVTRHLWWKRGIGKGIPSVVMVYEPPTAATYDAFKVPELKVILKDDRGLAVGGTKGELIERLLADDRTKFADLMAAEGEPVRFWQDRFFSCMHEEAGGEMVPCLSLASREGPCKHMAATAHMEKLFDVYAWAGIQNDSFRKITRTFLVDEVKRIASDRGISNATFEIALNLTKIIGAPPPAA